jgi:hypothetical protein
MTALKEGHVLTGKSDQERTGSECPMDFGFTYSAYSQLLSALDGAGYEFQSFSDAEQLLRENSTPFVLLRRDIDFDLNCAVRLAELEFHAGVRSTYCLLLRTLHYNVFSSEGTRRINQILEMGHWFGLHFDCAAYPTDYGTRQFAEACQREVGILQAWFRNIVQVVSYHRPAPAVLSGDPGFSYPLPHTYMPVFTKSIKYYADSRGVWRFGHPLESDDFRARRPLQLLMHPVWWTSETETPVAKLERYISGQVSDLKQSVTANCTVVL